MKTVFADTSFFVAYLNSGDDFHELAQEYMATFPGRFMTTAWILAELGNYLAQGRNRRLFMPLVKQFRSDQRTRYISPAPQLFEKGLAFYNRRLNKDWSFTNCTSFVLMLEKRVAEALSADHHFEQAGFQILLK